MLKKILVALLATFLIATPAGATNPDHSTVVWTMHGNSTPDHPFTETQTFLAFESENPILACETWYQVDTYKTGHPFGTSVFTLSSPSEDAQWIKSWKFVYGGDCAPITGVSVSATSLCTVPADGTATITTVTKHWTKAHKGDKPVFVDEVTTVKTVKDSGCTTPEAPKPHPVKHHVSYTG